MFLTIGLILHFHTLQHHFPLSANCPPNFIALCQSGLEITVTDTHPAHFRGIISMQSVQHVATKHRSLAQDHYQKLLPHLCWLFRSTGGFQNMEELPYMCCSLLANDHVIYLFF